MKMENLGVEIVDGQRLMKVERDWGSSSTSSFFFLSATRDILLDYLKYSII